MTATAGASVAWCTVACYSRALTLTLTLNPDPDAGPDPSPNPYPNTSLTPTLPLPLPLPLTLARCTAACCWRTTGQGRTSSPACGRACPPACTRLRWTQLLERRVQRWRRWEPNPNPSPNSRPSPNPHPHPHPGPHPHPNPNQLGVTQRRPHWIGQVRYLLRLTILGPWLGLAQPKHGPS